MRSGSKNTSIGPLEGEQERLHERRRLLGSPLRDAGMLYWREGLDHGIGHFMLFEADSEARALAPPIPKLRQTSSAASDRKSALLPWSRQAV